MHTYEKIDGGNRSKMLEVQYRMHQDISNWASRAMYNGKLMSHDSVKNRKLVTLPLVADMMNAKSSDAKDSLENVTLLLVDTAGCEMYEIANEAGSRYNEGEANIVVSHVKSLLALGLRAEDIAVITPYNGQVELLRKMLLPDVPKLEIRSVDGFQGGEREAVVISLVRSSARGGMNGIGFLRDERRLNVAVTRAKRQFAVICDSETVTQDRFLKGLLNWMEKKGDYRSGAEYTTVMHTDGAAIRTIAAPPAKVHKQATQKVHAKKENGKVASVDSVPPSLESIPQNSEMRNASTRIELMEEIKTFSESAKKGDNLSIFPSSDYDCIVARELASQLGLGCRNGECPNELVMEVLKETRRPDVIVAPAEETHADNVTKFAQLAVDDNDDSSESSNVYDDTTSTKNKLLKQLAMERQKRSSEQLKSQPVQLTPVSAKIVKKKKGQQLRGATHPSKQEIVDDLEGLDDMAFLDAQIEKVQTSHGRKIEAKGKGYRSVVSLLLPSSYFIKQCEFFMSNMPLLSQVNGILLASPSPRDEPKRNGAVSSALQAKLKSKEADRKLKKKAK
jgi:ATP-dependent RNA/DNA helicase IGHMBP2